MLNNIINLKVTINNLEELEILQERLKWEQEFILPQWAYTTEEYLAIKTKMARMKNKIRNLSNS